MLKLYGFAASNYFNMVKLSLMEKGVPFEVVPFDGCSNPDVMAISPRGKIPILETSQGFLSETSVILDWVEQTQEGPALLPSAPFARAQVMALAKEIELYIELPARTCYPEAFFDGRPRPEAIKAKARRDLLAGFASLERRARFSPFVAGDAFTLADVFFLYSVDLAYAVGKQLFDIDFLAGLPAARDLFERLECYPNVRQIAADREADKSVFLARVGGGA